MYSGLLYQLEYRAVVRMVEYACLFTPWSEDISSILASCPLTLQPGQGITQGVNTATYSHVSGLTGVGQNIMIVRKRVVFEAE